MLPIYLYKKMMLEKKANPDYIQPGLFDNIREVNPRYIQPGLFDNLNRSKTPIYSNARRIPVINENAPTPASSTARRIPVVDLDAKKPDTTFWEKVKGTWSNLKARGAGLLTGLKGGGGGGRLGALKLLLGGIAGYSALNMAEPYFVRRLRESAYGGQYTTPVTDLLGAAKGPNADEEANKFFEAVRQRFNRLQQGGYAPGVFDPVTGSFNDYRNKSTIFSPIWNALRYLNIFDSHTAPVYEKHYRTPEEFVNSLEQYANRLRQEINEDAIRMEPHEHRKAMNYLNQLQERIRNYRRELNRGGIVGYSGIL